MFDNSLEVTILIVTVLIAVLVGVGVGLAMGLSRGRSREHEVAERELLEARSTNDSAQARIGELATSNAQLSAQVDGLNEQLSFVKHELAQAQQAEQLRIQREQEKTQADAERRQQEQAKSLNEQSKVLSALAPVQKNLDTLQQKVQQIEEGRKHEMGTLGEQLKGLGEQQARLDRETSSLSAALRNNTVRGAWGEAQLKNIVESAGLLEHVDFDTQVVVTGADGKIQRPDMVVHLPGGKTIPIDAKVPYADYQQACEIPDTATPEELERRNALLRAHAKALRDHVKALSDKAYWSAFETTPDFVVAFIPNESLLQAALEADPTLMDDAFAQKIALTSPVTLWAVLKSVAYAWQQQSLTDDAKTLFDLSRELYERFSVLGERASKLGGSITKTVGAYNQFVATLESRVLPTARKMQKIDANTIIEQVDLLDADKANVREITAPEAQPTVDSVEPVISSMPQAPTVELFGQAGTLSHIVGESDDHEGAVGDSDVGDSDVGDSDVGESGDREVFVGDVGLGESGDREGIAREGIVDDRSGR